MKSKNFHFIGIGGIGMSALAKLLLKKKCKVKGSDIKANDIIEELIANGADIQIGHNENFVNENDIVIFSSAIDEKNEEFRKAKKMSLKMLHRSDLLDELMKNKKPMLVTGTHGKTTTTALLTEVALENNCDPSFVIGGILNSHKTNAHLGEGAYFIAEADESDGSFCKTAAYAAIVTSLEKEHLDYWKTFDNLKYGFQTFYSKIQNKDLLFWCIDDENLKRLNFKKGISYGFSKEANLRAENIRRDGFKTIFDITFFDKNFKNITINLIGNHNVLNALSVFGLCYQLKIDLKIIKKAFESFKSTKRRLERIGEAQKTLFFDDYAHHPSEIKCSLKALKEVINEKKLICIFQPHRYTRLRDLLSEFQDSFSQADEVIITNIYTALEKPIENINEKLLVNLLKEKNIDVKHIPDENLQDYILKNVNPLDVVIALGAGDISLKIRKIFKEFKKIKKKIRMGIIYGGKSTEHEISIKSFENYVLGFDKTLYDLKYFKITKEGKWLLQKDSIFENNTTDGIFASKILSELKSCDVCFPILHGPMGEDGQIAAFLETLDIPYVGADYFTSAVCMDKAFSKSIVKFHGIKVLDFIEITIEDWKQNKEKYLIEINNKFKYPLYIKPNHLGSSIGIKYTENKEKLSQDIDDVFQFDNSLIVEPRLFAREVQAAVIGNEAIFVGEIGEVVINDNQFFSYDEKYVKSNVKIKIPIDAAEEKIKEIKDISKRIYRALKLNGFARIDYFMDKDQNVYFNEVNPIPGFTSQNSLFPKMLDFIGISNKEMLDLFVIYAFHRKRKNKKFEK